MESNTISAIGTLAYIKCKGENKDFLNFHNLDKYIFLFAGWLVGLFLCFIGVYLLCNDVLVYVVQQCGSAICIHISSPLEPPSHRLRPPLEVITEQGAELLVLCSSFALALCLTHGSVYICQCHSLSSYLPLPHFCPQVHSLCSCFYSWPSNRFNRMIFLDSIYKH